VNKRDARWRDVSISKGGSATRLQAEKVRMIGKLVFLVVTLSLPSFSEPLWGADADSLQRLLIDGSRKEAKLVFYMSVETEFARSLTTAFEDEESRPLQGRSAFGVPLREFHRVTVGVENKRNKVLTSRPIRLRIQGKFYSRRF
jgi:hypothetical protein